MSFSKKMKKLRRDPAKFFADMKFIQKWTGRNANKNNNSLDNVNADDSNVIVEDRIEKKTFGVFDSTQNKVKFYFYNRTINSEKSLTSLILIKKPETYLIHDQYAHFFLSDKEFIGFRDRYSYFLYYEKDTYLAEDFQLYFEDNTFRENPFGEFRNIFVFDPNNVFPILVRMSSPEARLIVILSENTENKTIDFVTQYYEYIDVLIYHETLVQYIEKLLLRRRIRFTSDVSLEKIIKSIIIENSKKEKNLLFPIMGVHDEVQNIDALNESDADFVIFMNKSYNTHVATSQNLTLALTKNIHSMLVKEESYFRYKTLIDTQNIEELLKYSLIDGARYEII